MREMSWEDSLDKATGSSACSHKPAICTLNSIVTKKAGIIIL